MLEQQQKYFLNNLFPIMQRYAETEQVPQQTIPQLIEEAYNDILKRRRALDFRHIKGIGQQKPKTEIGWRRQADEPFSTKYSGRPYATTIFDALLDARV